MGFKDLLKEKLKDKINLELLNFLPSGYQSVGDIIIINLKQELEKYKKLIGETILIIFPKTRVVCNKKGGITGEFREPQIELIAGNKNTETIHFENGCYYKFDVRKLMFAKGNLNERIRIAKQVKAGEIVVDMFAGLGYFTVPIAKLSNVKKVFSIELNPTAFFYLNENLRLNEISNKVEAINGDSKIEVPKLAERYGRIADRVVMGYLPPPKSFLPAALKIIKKGGILHYETLIKVGNEKKEIETNLQDIEEISNKEGFDVKLIFAKKVKGYGPKIDHYTLDVKIV
ncbi:MAG: class I SAM-dependent methyltransferase family protein [Candidatus Pacearchaeota archaeon]